MGGGEGAIVFDLKIDAKLGGWSVGYEVAVTGFCGMFLSFIATVGFSLSAGDACSDEAAWRYREGGGVLGSSWDMTESGQR